MAAIVEQSVTEDGIVVIGNIIYPPNPSGDKLASHAGAGTLEMLEVVNLLEQSGITCCLVGIATLRYYGAKRVFENWEVCVKTEQLSSAESILTSQSNGPIYEPCPHRVEQLRSLHHTFPYLKLKGVWLRFYLVPSDACHLECTPSHIERSGMSLPYPKLDIFAQSLLDTMSAAALTDLVDGMDLDDEWAAENLNLCGTQDIAWAASMNHKIAASRPGKFLVSCSTEPRSIKKFWEEITRTKSKRIGPEYPPGFLVTRFRVADSGDPRLDERLYV
nr:hypothetical protein CFP56_65553 [Quercus suber]